LKIALRDPFQEIEGISKGHFHIQEDQIRGLPLDQCQPLLNIGCLPQVYDSLTVLPQIVLENFPAMGLILHDDRPELHHCFFSFSRTRIPVWSPFRSVMLTSTLFLYISFKIWILLLILPIAFDFCFLWLPVLSSWDLLRPMPLSSITISRSSSVKGRTPIFKKPFSSL